jgi:diguanylate cyclase (GGDEF)-like protein
MATSTVHDEFADAVHDAVDAAPTVSLLQIDLDGFAELNESAGRDVGDRALAAAIATAEAAADEGWTFARTGGDELSLLAPGVSLETAFLRAERLRIEVDDAIAGELPKGVSCTASIGVANAPRDAKTAEELLRKASSALYAAKEQGGDAVGLTPSEEMVLRSSYYSVGQLGRLRALAERMKVKEAVLLREALEELLRKYDRS